MSNFVKTRNLLTRLALPGDKSTGCSWPTGFRPPAPGLMPDVAESRKQRLRREKNK